MDKFQEDFFNVLSKARQLSNPSSEVIFVFLCYLLIQLELLFILLKIFQDSVELQKFFIQTRDKLCQDFKYHSAALKFNIVSMNAQISSDLKENQLQEESDEKVGIKLDQLIVPVENVTNNLFEFFY